MHMPRQPHDTCHPLDACHPREGEDPYSREQDGGTKAKKSLPTDAIHIWQIPTDQHQNKILEYYQILDSEEQVRAKRFIFEHDQRRFIIAHATLRIILSNYLNITPQSLIYENETHGKPQLATQHQSDLQFSLSHGDHFIVIAVTHLTPIGVDVEYMDAKESKDEIVERFFSEAENRAYQRLKDSEKTIGFYQAWTRKEAFVKAKGTGILNYSLENFSVSLTPSEPAKILSLSEQDTSDLTQWHLSSFTPHPHYCAAVCWYGEQKTIRFFENLASF